MRAYLNSRDLIDLQKLCTSVLRNEEVYDILTRERVKELCTILIEIEFKAFNGALNKVCRLSKQKQLYILNELRENMIKMEDSDDYQKRGKETEI